MIPATRKIICVLLLCALYACTPDPDQKPQIMVFAAASLNEVMTEVGESFEQAQGIKVNFNFAGSNVLAQQLIAAPKADLFLSANKAWMRRLGQAGRIVPGSRQLVLGNSLVIIVNRNSSLHGLPQGLFCLPDFEHLSIGNPQAVPAGIYARQWLEKLSCDGTSVDDSAAETTMTATTITAWDAVAERIAPAPNVRAALGMVEADRDIPGIVYATDAAMSDKVSVIYHVSGNNAPDITYHAALVENKSSHERTRLFLKFLSGEQASKVFKSYGFSVPEAIAR